MSRELLKKAIGYINPEGGGAALIKEIEAELAKPETSPSPESIPAAWMFDWFDESGNEIKDWTTTRREELKSMVAKCGAHNIRPLSISQRPYTELPRHPRFDAFIRAFWRRIDAHKNNYGKELPEKMPVEFRASMETALLVFDNDESGFHQGRPMQRLTDDEKKEFSGLFEASNLSAIQIIDVIETALIEKNR
jgi:hypothetical protein